MTGERDGSGFHVVGAMPTRAPNDAISPHIAIARVGMGARQGTAHAHASVEAL
jgi:hypothetical protein